MVATRRSQRAATSTDPSAGENSVASSEVHPAVELAADSKKPKSRNRITKEKAKDQVKDGVDKEHNDVEVGTTQDINEVVSWQQDQPKNSEKKIGRTEPHAQELNDEQVEKSDVQRTPAMLKDNKSSTKKSARKSAGGDDGLIVHKTPKSAKDKAASAKKSALQKVEERMDDEIENQKTPIGVKDTKISAKKSAGHQDQEDEADHEQLEQDEKPQPKKIPGSVGEANSLAKKLGCEADTEQSREDAEKQERKHLSSGMKVEDKKSSKKSSIKASKDSVAKGSSSAVKVSRLKDENLDPKRHIRFPDQDDEIVLELDKEELAPAKPREKVVDSDSESDAAPEEVQAVQAKRVAKDLSGQTKAAENAAASARKAKRRAIQERDIERKKARLTESALPESVLLAAKKDRQKRLEQEQDEYEREQILAQKRVQFGQVGNQSKAIRLDDSGAEIVHLSAIASGELLIADPSSSSFFAAIGTGTASRVSRMHKRVGAQHNPRRSLVGR